MAVLQHVLEGHVHFALSCYRQVLRSAENAKVAEAPFLHCKASTGSVLTRRALHQVLFHLQMRRPAVLPPLHELFRDSSDAFASRPLHMGQDIRPGVLEVRP